MTNSYIKGLEQEKKYRNRDAKECLKDEEFKKYKEEERNTQKMSTILTSLNAPGLKRKAIEQKRMEQSFNMSRKISSSDKQRPEFSLTKGTMRESVIEAEEENEEDAVSRN